MDPNNPNVAAAAIQQQMIAARKNQVESMLFSACYAAMKKEAQNLLDQMAKKGVNGELAVNMVHVAAVALGAGFREMAIEHVKAPVASVDNEERKARDLGVKIYKESWQVLVKAHHGGGVTDERGTQSGTGILGLDGKPV